MSNKLNLSNPYQQNDLQHREKNLFFSIMSAGSDNQESSYTCYLCIDNTQLYFSIKTCACSEPFSSDRIDWGGNKLRMNPDQDRSCGQLAPKYRQLEDWLHFCPQKEQENSWREGKGFQTIRTYAMLSWIRPGVGST